MAKTLWLQGVCFSRNGSFGGVIWNTPFSNIYIDIPYIPYRMPEVQEEEVDHACVLFDERKTYWNNPILVVQRTAILEKFE